jgi:hypothetical protein
MTKICNKIGGDADSCPTVILMLLWVAFVVYAMVQVL